MRNTLVRLTQGRGCQLWARRPRCQGAAVLYGRESTKAEQKLHIKEEVLVVPILEGRRHGKTSASDEFRIRRQTFEEALIGRAVLKMPGRWGRHFDGIFRF